mmetsp:Transcript_18332/g.29387  ORF Transcript_18332/g.29387 Transcript_18332/m.29387 type:complete len:111 (+) Transcript_18332:3827-4159(+)
MLARNFCVRSLLGAENMASGGPSSAMTPWSIKQTRSASSRANPISWVASTMVIPSSRSLRSTSSTSPTSSGSRADVISSKSIVCGCIAKARITATRCCCPPDSWSGYLCM